MSHPFNSVTEPGSMQEAAETAGNDRARRGSDSDSVAASGSLGAEAAPAQAGDFEDLREWARERRGEWVGKDVAALLADRDRLLAGAEAAPAQEIRKALSDLADAGTRGATAAYPVGAPPEFSALMDAINDAYSRGLRAVAALPGAAE